MHRRGILHPTGVHIPWGAGTSPGINIQPGSDDDGWIVPHPVTLEDGSRVQLYKDGEALRAAYDAIRHAKHRVLLETYIFAGDDSGTAFAELLAARARAGLWVYVIYDDFGSHHTGKRFFAKLRDAGVHLHAFHPVWPLRSRFSWRPYNRDHRKLLVIDDEIAWMGGLNIGNEYAGSWIVDHHDDANDFWRDTAISVVGPAARHFFDSYVRTWRYCRHGGPITRAQYTFNLPVRSGHLPAGDLGVLASVPTVKTPLRPMLSRLLRRARRSVQMTMAYFAPDDALINELCAAARRGARVQLLLGGRLDVPAVGWAARAFYATLMDAGVEVYERQGAILHAKTLVIDGELSLVGSTNLDYRSIEFNLELSALIESTDFGTQMQRLFDNDLRYSLRIDPAKWGERPIHDRFFTWAVSRLRHFL